jgi:hypothetical protein
MTRPLQGARSTAAVLWLMMLLVFLPIAAAHLVARVTETDVPVATAHAAAGASERALR